jgi:hypothetical protein
VEPAYHHLVLKEQEPALHFLNSFRVVYIALAFLLMRLTSSRISELEQAEVKLKRELLENRYDLRRTSTERLSDFIDEVFLTWSQLNKRSLV